MYTVTVPQYYPYSSCIFFVILNNSSHHGNAASAGPQLDRHLEENDEDEEDSKLSK